MPGFHSSTRLVIINYRFSRFKKSSKKESPKKKTLHKAGFSR